MGKLILFDQLALAVFVPPNLPPRESERMARTLNEVRFRRQVTQAVRAVFRKHPDLARARVLLTA